MLFPPNAESVASVEAFLAEARKHGAAEREGWRVKRDGSWFWGNTVLTALPGDDGALAGFVAVSRDMSERKRLEDEMKRLAATDALTGAANRRQAEIWLETNARARGEDGADCAVLMLDVDHFKLVNDRFGHAAGDDVLRALVRICESALRVQDLMARWGGEEFLIALPGADVAMGERVAERLRAALMDAGLTGPSGEPLPFTVSIGVAAGAGESPRTLIARADAALYDAKRSGRNRVTLAA
jgi:diguanylate cyclase (GGDEF)-like protein